MRGTLVCLSVVGLSVAAGTAQTPPSATDLARQLQAHYNTVRDFTADFVHTYRGGALKQTFNERGDVRVKKPGRMYWTYAVPEKKEFISDGSKIFSYMKADKICYVTEMPRGNEASSAVAFLSGQGDLIRDFNASVPSAQPEGQWQLDLQPKTSQPDFLSLRLLIDRKSLVLRGLMSVDQQGGTSSFAFTNLRENVGLTDNQFAFKIPRGVEVR